MSASRRQLSADETRAARAALGLSASEMAQVVGLNDGAAWRKWERMGVSGPGAVLVSALLTSQPIRRYFGLSLSYNPPPKCE